MTVRLIVLPIIYPDNREKDGQMMPTQDAKFMVYWHPQAWARHLELKKICTWYGAEADCPWRWYRVPHAIVFLNRETGKERTMQLRNRHYRQLEYTARPLREYSFLSELFSEED
jgi:hypothetical protein